MSTIISILFRNAYQWQQYHSPSLSGCVSISVLSFKSGFIATAGTRAKDPTLVSNYGHNSTEVRKKFGSSSDHQLTFAGLCRDFFQLITPCGVWSRANVSRSNETCCSPWIRYRVSCCKLTTGRARGKSNEVRKLHWCNRYTVWYNGECDGP